MTARSEAIIAFAGRVACTRAANGPLGLTLIGRAQDSPDEVAHLALACAAPSDLPETLDDARVDRLDRRSYRISSAQGDWTIRASAVHLHRDAGRAFYRAIPARAVPLRKRIFWRVMLAVMASALGRRLLRRHVP